jgi:glycosyltransferase involved in cell wall biosynthesis
MWWSILSELGKGPLASRIILLDRVGSAPKIPGIQTRRIPVFRYGDAEEGAAVLDNICQEENAELFLSTYYTYTNVTPSLLMLYDMIPELFEKVGPVDAPPAWRDKYHAIVNSSAFAVISQSTAHDLSTFYPQTAQKSLAVIHCAVSDEFRVHSEEDIAAFKAANGIDLPYFLLVGRRDNHKNVALFFQAFSRLPNREQYAIVMAGGGNALEPELRELAGPAAGYAGFFSDQDLSLAYSGAIALVYPSIYEGFGLPILEAMQSGCPVITCQNSSLPEVAGSAALYVGEYDYEEMNRALLSVQQPDVRSYLIKRGLERAKLFSWQKSAELLADAIQKTVTGTCGMQISGGK